VQFSNVLEEFRALSVLYKESEPNCTGPKLAPQQLVSLIRQFVDPLILNLCVLSGEILPRPRSQNLSAASMA